VGVHPDGVAAEHDDFGISFAPEVDLPGIARAAFGAWARTIARADELPRAVKEASAPADQPCCPCTCRPRSRRDLRPLAQGRQSRLPRSRTAAQARAVIVANMRSPRSDFFP
jgi:hypothetical protein